VIYGVLADLVVIAHLLFVAFAVLGALLVLKWPRVAWFHLPAVLWAALIEFAHLAGGTGYETGFIEHYLLPLLYPPGLTRGLQIGLGILVLTVNLAVYAWLVRRLRRR
jgi:hypothetical protein